MAATRPRKAAAKKAAASRNGDTATVVRDAVDQASRLAQQVAARGPVLVEPEDDEVGDDILFVTNGYIRCVIAGETYKLRRPFLGEADDLEKSKEAGEERLGELNEEHRADAKLDLERAREITEEANQDGVAPLRKLELDEEATQLGVKAMRRGHEMARLADRARADWWREVFTVLTPHGHPPPEELPAWVTDPDLINQVIIHWRTAPLAYGSR